MGKKSDPRYSDAAMRWYLGIENAKRAGQGLEPLKLLRDDPAYKLFKAQSKANEKLYKTESKRQIGYVNANRQRSLSNLDFSDPIELEQIRGGMEARGMLNSGQTLLRQSRQQAVQQQQRAQIIADAAQAIGNIRAELAARIADQRQRRAQTRLDYLSNGYV